jgi:transposase InsO family protein
LVRASLTASQGRYGSPRIHRDLLEDHDERVSRKRVMRLMQEDGLKARARKRVRCTTMSDHDQPVAANLLARDFTADAPISGGSVTRRRSQSARAAGCTSPRSSICVRGLSWAGQSAQSTIGT